MSFPPFVRYSQVAAMKAESLFAEQRLARSFRLKIAYDILDGYAVEPLMAFGGVVALARTSSRMLLRNSSSDRRTGIGASVSGGVCMPPA